MMLESEQTFKSKFPDRKGPRFVKLRHIKRDGLIKRRINSLSLSGGNQITGHIKLAGKRKLESEVNNPNGGKLKRL